MEYKRQTINDLFSESVKRFGDRAFLRHKVSGKWVSLSFSEVGEKVRRLALGLHNAGVKSGDRVAIWSENRPEWNVADLALLALGAVDVPIYTTQARHEIEYIMSDAGATAIFASSTFLAEGQEIKKTIPKLSRVISFDPLPSGFGNGRPDQLQELIEMGAKLDKERPDLFDQLSHAVRPEDLATQVYTSGTTGEPKGVMLTHRNLAANVIFSYRWAGFEGRRDLVLSYLPLSHIFERGAWYIFMYGGFEIAYAESIEAVPANLVEVRPTLMTSVPRMFEKMYARMLETGIALPFPRAQVFMWAIAVARRWAEQTNSGRQPGLALTIEHALAGRLVYAKMREVLGGRIREFISGGAPLAPEIAYVFAGAGILILQGYGLTETSPTISSNTEQFNRIGTVGKVIDGVQVKIAQDGEILVKGDNVTSGYFNSPEKTREAFTEDGWFCTGDIGNIDSDGFLSITDRKKDLIKTSGGKYVAPQKLESLIMASRFVSQVVVVGNQRKFPAALVVPNIEMLRSYAQLKGISCAEPEDLIRNARIIDLIERQVDKYTADLSRYEKIKRVALLGHELTIEAGELTPTMKPRRRFIEQKYRSVIDTLYVESQPQAASVS